MGGDLHGVRLILRAWALVSPSAGGALKRTMAVSMLATFLAGVAYSRSICRDSRFPPSRSSSLDALFHGSRATRQAKHSTPLRGALQDLRTLGVRVNLNLANSHSAMNSVQEGAGSSQGRAAR